jgi:hypothetical protein
MLLLLLFLSFFVDDYVIDMSACCTQEDQGFPIFVVQHGVPAFFVASAIVGYDCVIMGYDCRAIVDVIARGVDAIVGITAKEAMTECNSQQDGQDQSQYCCYLHMLLLLFCLDVILRVAA